MYARRHVTLNNLTKQHVLSFYSVFGRGLGLNAANRWYHARYKITFKILVIYRVIYTYFAYFTRPLTKAWSKLIVKVFLLEKLSAGVA